MSPAEKEDQSTGSPHGSHLMQWLTVGYFIFLGVSAYVFSKSKYRRMLNFMSSIPQWDKYFHFCATGMLCFLINAALSFRSFRIGKIRILWGTLIAMFMSITDEYSQTFIPGRVFDVWDIAAACSGAVVFGWIGLVLYEKEFKNPILRKISAFLHQSSQRGPPWHWVTFFRKK
jgi:VanZ family protein